MKGGERKREREKKQKKLSNRTSGASLFNNKPSGENELEPRFLGQYFRDIISGKRIDKYPPRELFLQAIGRGNQSCETAKDAFTVLKAQETRQDVPLLTMCICFFYFTTYDFKDIFVLVLLIRVYIYFFE